MGSGVVRTAGIVALGMVSLSAVWVGLVLAGPGWVEVAKLVGFVASGVLATWRLCRIA